MVSLFPLLTLITPVFSGWTFNSVSGYFIQDTNSSATTSLPDFGLESKFTWDSLISELVSLNSKGEDTYKLTVWARHGEAVHNVVKDEVGHDVWKTVGKEDIYNGEELFDDDLTTNGIDQVDALSTVWSNEIESGMPKPQSFYVSPLRRTLHTFHLTWGDSEQCKIVENLRERYGKYTPYRRHTKTWISSTFPGFDFEDGFTEGDELWTTKREDKDHVQDRAHNFLEEMFKNDGSLVISVTTHSGVIKQLLMALGHEEYDMETADVLPIVIKGRKS